MMLTLSGNTITLRDWTLDDVDVYAGWLTPEHVWHRLDGPYYPKPTANEIPALIERHRERISKAGWESPRSRLVIARNDLLIGVVSRYWIGAETNWLAVGIVIYDPDEWRQGIGYEALGLWSDYLFREMPGIVRLDLRTWSGNIGMMRLALKLGYLEEARFRMARIVDGEYYDGLGYGVLRSEWQQKYPNGFGNHLSDG